MLDQEPSEEDFAPDPTLTPRGILDEKPELKYLSAPLFIVALCVVFSLMAWRDPYYAELFSASRPLVFDKGEYWRLLTAIFVHAGLLHLLANMPLLIIFGWLLRSYFGFAVFPLAALIVGALANAGTLYFYDHRISIVGASGMVYAVAGLWMSFYLRYEVRFGFWKKLLRVTGVSMVLLFPTSYDPGTSYLAHVFGFILGLIAAGILMLGRRVP